MTPPIPPGRAQPPSTLQSHKTPNGIKSASPVVGAIKRPHAVGVFLQDLSVVEIVAVHKGNAPSGRTDYAQSQTVRPEKTQARFSTTGHRALQNRYNEHQLHEILKIEKYLTMPDVRHHPDTTTNPIRALRQIPEYFQAANLNGNKALWPAISKTAQSQQTAIQETDQALAAEHVLA